MSYLFTEMSLFLLLAAVVGAVVGWVVRGSRQDDSSDALARQHQSLKQEHARCADVEMRLTALQATHARCVDAEGRVSDLKSRLDSLRSKYADYEVVKAENNSLKADRANGAVAALAVDVRGASDKRAADLEAQVSRANDLRKEEAGVLEALRRSLDEALSERDSLLLSVEQYEAQLSANARRFHELETALEASHTEPAPHTPAPVDANIAYEADVYDESQAAPAPEPDEPSAVEPSPVEPSPVESPEPPEPPDDGPPRGLLAERPDDADDLKRLKGVGPAIERKLNAAGLYTFRQLAALSEADVSWLAQQIRTSSSRIARDRWIEQAEALIQES